LFDMRRREFIALVGGAATWPLAARGQQMMPVIGYIDSASLESRRFTLTGFQQGLREVGYADGQNLAIEYRWGNGQYDRLPALAADLVGRDVAAIVTGGGTVTALAAKAATTTIPIVFIVGGDPVEAGLIASLNRPGGNATGVSILTVALVAKRLELLRELVPSASVIPFLVNPASPNAEVERNEVLAAASMLGIRVPVMHATTEHDIDAIFAALERSRPPAILISTDPFFTSQRNHLVALAAHYAIPAVYAWREYSAAGGLMSYGTNLNEMYRQAGVYSGRILRGTRPEELPVVQPTHFELVINLRTAKSLGLTVPPALLARADEVIE
jgi:ABC-type uncharacterized transport system substrate-binding protein